MSPGRLTSMVTAGGHPRSCRSPRRAASAGWRSWSCRRRSRSSWSPCRRSAAGCRPCRRRTGPGWSAPAGPSCRRRPGSSPTGPGRTSRSCPDRRPGRASRRRRRSCAAPRRWRWRSCGRCRCRCSAGRCRGPTTTPSKESRIGRTTAASEGPSLATPVKGLTTEPPCTSWS